MSTLFKKLAEDGYVTFDGLAFGDSSKEIATNIGTMINIPGAKTVQELRPTNKASLEASSYSGNYGVEEFPFHSDMAHWFRPPRYLLLCCRVPALSIETRVVKSERIFEGEDIHDLRRALFRPRRRLNGRLSPLRLVEGDFYRWDSLFIQPINKLALSLRSSRLLKLSRMNRGFGSILSVKLIRSQSDNARSRHHPGSFIYHGPPGLLRSQRSSATSDQGSVRHSADPH